MDVIGVPISEVGKYSSMHMLIICVKKKKKEKKNVNYPIDIATSIFPLLASVVSVPIFLVTLSNIEVYYFNICINLYQPYQILYFVKKFTHSSCLHPSLMLDFQGID